MVAAHGVSVSYPSATLTSGAQPKTMTEIMLFSDRLHHGLATDRLLVACSTSSDAPRAVAPRAEGGDQKLPAGLLRQPAVDIRVVQAEMLLRSPRRARLGTARLAWPAAYPVLLGVVLQ